WPFAGLVGSNPSPSARRSALRALRPARASRDRALGGLTEWQGVRLESGSRDESPAGVRSPRPPRAGVSPPLLLAGRSAMWPTGHVVFVVVARSPRRGAPASRRAPGCGAVGSARVRGTRGRRFESCHPDHGGVAQRL